MQWNKILYFKAKQEKLNIKFSVHLVSSPHRNVQYVSVLHSNQSSPKMAVSDNCKDQSPPPHPPPRPLSIAMQFFPGSVKGLVTYCLLFIFIFK